MNVWATIGQMRILRDYLAEHMDVAHHWATHGGSPDGTPCLLNKAVHEGVVREHVLALIGTLSGRIVAQFTVMTGYSQYVVEFPLLATPAGREEALSRLDRKIAELEEFEAAVPSKAEVPLVHA